MTRAVVAGWLCKDNNKQHDSLTHCKLLGATDPSLFTDQENRVTRSSVIRGRLTIKLEVERRLGEYREMFSGLRKEDACTHVVF